MKVWYLSKTAWASIVSIAVGAAASIYSVVSGNEALGLEEQAAVTLVVVGVISLILRVFTKDSVTL